MHKNSVFFFEFLVLRVEFLLKTDIWFWRSIFFFLGWRGFEAALLSAISVFGFWLLVCYTAAAAQQTLLVDSVGRFRASLLP